MTRILGVLTLLALLCVSACGDGRMNVEEYATACGELGKSVEQGIGVGDFSEAINFLEDTLDGLEELKPPEELERLHQLKVAGSELALGVLREVGTADLEEAEEELAGMSLEEREENAQEMMQDLMDRLSRMEEALLRLETELEELQAQIMVEQDNLSQETYEIMAKEGCISTF